VSAAQSPDEAQRIAELGRGLLGGAVECATPLVRTR
jgi:hypothetical protein